MSKSRGWIYPCEPPPMTKPIRKGSFIRASQAKQVFYFREGEMSNWYVVLKVPPRGFHDLEVV